MSWVAVSLVVYTLDFKFVKSYKTNSLNIINIIAPVKNPLFRHYSTLCLKDQLFPRDSQFVQLQTDLWNKVPQLAGDKGYMYEAKTSTDISGYTAMAPLNEGTGYLIGSWLSNQKLPQLNQKREALIFLMEAPSQISNKQAWAWMRGVKELAEPLHKFVQDINDRDFDCLTKLLDAAKGECLKLFDFNEFVPSRVALINVLAESSPSEAKETLGKINQGLNINKFLIEFAGRDAHSLHLTGLGLTSASMREEPVVSPLDKPNYEFTRFTLRDEHPEIATRPHPSRPGEIEIGSREQTPSTEFGFYISEQERVANLFMPEGQWEAIHHNVANFDAGFAPANETIQRAKQLLTGL